MFHHNFFDPLHIFNKYSSFFQVNVSHLTFSIASKSTGHTVQVSFLRTDYRSLYHLIQQSLYNGRDGNSYLRLVTGRLTIQELFLEFSLHETVNQLYHSFSLFFKILKATVLLTMSCSFSVCQQGLHLLRNGQIISRNLSQSHGQLRPLS